MLDLKALESALAVVGDVGKGELTVPINGMPITMRVLSADEDIDCHRYARMTENEGEEDENFYFVERYKRSVLAHAIVQIGSLDLRNETVIATGGVTEKGVPIKVAKHVAVRKIMDSWARVATMALFQKYLELLHRVEAEAEQAIQYDIEDLDAEIARVESRLADLKKEKEHSLLFQKDPSPGKMVGDADAQLRQQAQVMLEKQTQQETPAAAPTTGRQRIMPTVPVPPPTTVAPVPIKAPEPDVAVNPFAHMHDSMGDGQDAIAAETARLSAARQAARQRSATVASEPPPIQAPIQHNPPHRVAANVADAIFEGVEDTMRAARIAPVDKNIESYKLEPTPIIDRSRYPQTTDKSQRVRVNEDPHMTQSNPRFKPARR